MDEVLRRSAAHMLTPDINDPLLSDDALHHLNRVLRLREGESVTVTNGNGEWRPGIGANRSTVVAPSASKCP